MSDYTPNNNPYIPGDPYSYDLKWMVNDIKLMENLFADLDDNIEFATEEADRAEREADRAVDEANRSKDEALISEGYARGTQDGEVVDPDSPYHENNSKYYSEQSSNSADEAEAAKQDARDIADHIGDTVSGLVTEWLNDNITQPSTPPIDKSLTVANAAADSKAAGDFIKENISDIMIVDTFYQGGFTNAAYDGNISAIILNSNTNRIRSNNGNTFADTFRVPGGVRVRFSVDSGYKYYVQIYSSVTEKGTEVPAVSTEPNTFGLTEDYGFIVWLGKTDDSDLTPADYTHLHIYYENTLKEADRFLEGFIDGSVNNISAIKEFYTGGFTNAGYDVSIDALILNTNTNRIRSISHIGYADTFRIPGNVRVKISVDSGYKYAAQIYDETTHKALENFASSTDPAEFTSADGYGLIIWLGKTDDSVISLADASHLHVIYENEVKDAITEVSTKLVEITVEMLRKKSPVTFVNTFEPGSLLTLPSGFSSLPITISRNGNRYGYAAEIDSRMVTATGGLTYYVSPDGDDTNSGLTPLDPLHSINTAIGMTASETIILLPGRYIKNVHFTNTPITRAINLIGIGYVVIDNVSNTAPITFNNKAYIENITFINGSTNLQANLTTHLFTLVNCVFANSLTTNNVTILGGNTLAYRCGVFNAAYDGFNYHSNSGNYPTAIEIECYGKFFGIGSATDSHNGSTIHETGSKAIRIGCNYVSSKGATLADADGAKSVNIEITSGGSLTALNTRDASICAINTAEMWLYNCMTFGSPKDLIADNATIHTTRTYQTEQNINGGTIEHIA